MNAANVLKLNDWVRDNRMNIKTARRTQKALAEDAAGVLGFKVSVSALREVLIANGIETRQKSQHERTIEAKDQEIKSLRGMLIKVITASNVPDWLREEMLTEDLNDEVKEVLRGRVAI
jgi:hypothetical protein